MAFGEVKEIPLAAFGEQAGGSRHSAQVVESPSRVEFWTRVARVASRFRSRYPRRFWNPCAVVTVVSRVYWSAARTPSQREPPEWL
jgi:hypothetical protein